MCHTWRFFSSSSDQSRARWFENALEKSWS